MYTRTYARLYDARTRPCTGIEKKEARSSSRKIAPGQPEFSRIIWLMAYSAAAFPAYSITVPASFASPGAATNEGQVCARA